MKNVFSLRCALDTLNALMAAIAMLAVLQSFVIGRHYIIPTGWLLIALVFGNLAFYGFAGRNWARMLAFWTWVLVTGHLFFALFWSVRYRSLLGQSFEPVAIVAVVLLAGLVWQYAKRNRLFH